MCRVNTRVSGQRPAELPPWGWQERPSARTEGKSTNILNAFTYFIFFNRGQMLRNFGSHPYFLSPFPNQGGMGFVLYVPHRPLHLCAPFACRWCSSHRCPNEDFASEPHGQRTAGLQVFVPRTDTGYTGWQKAESFCLSKRKF